MDREDYALELQPGAAEPMNINDADVSQLWSIHFPARHNSNKSRDLCAELFHIVRNVAHETNPEDAPINRLHQALAILGVPQDQFHLFEYEMMTRG